MAAASLFLYFFFFKPLALLLYICLSFVPFASRLYICLTFVPFASLLYHLSHFCTIFLTFVPFFALLYICFILNKIKIKITSKVEKNDLNIMLEKQNEKIVLHSAMPKAVGL